VAESGTALSGVSYTPGADPDFSYLSLLQPNLPFVQLIRSYLGLASSLASMAETMRGGAGSSLLADRSQVLQYVKTYAWPWMMANAAEGRLPLYLDYTTATGHSIPIYDTFSQTDTADAFTPADKSILTNFLNIMPAALLQYEQLIVNGPINGMTGGAGTTGGYESSIQSIDGIADGALAHEISLTLLAGLVNNISVVAQEWNALWNASAAPAWDCADVYENYPVRPMPSNFNPYGDVAKEEDFATIFSDWLGSGTPRLKPNQSSSILEQAIYAAWQSGKPGGPPADDTILLQKTLIMASLFTDPSSMMLNLYYHNDYIFPNAIELSASPVRVSPTTLSFGGYTFALQNGAITGVTSPASQVTYKGQVVSIPALSYTFPTLVPIPTFAASRWGMN
jgi:hypothetical protein